MSIFEHLTKWEKTVYSEPLLRVELEETRDGVACTVERASGRL